MNIHAATYVARELSDRLYAAGFRGVCDMDRIGSVISAYTTYHRARKGLTEYLVGCGVRGDYAPRIAVLAERAFRRGGGDWGGAGAFATILVALNDASGMLRDDPSRVRSLTHVMEQYEREELDREGVRKRLRRGSYWRGRQWIANEVMLYWCA
jgi:hypothetical protein